MGKPFHIELSRLEETYAWALEQDVTVLTDFLCRAFELPLLAIGSGGSFSAAAYTTYLHQQATGLPSDALTPLQFVGLRSTRDVAALFLSAGGRNQDILAALRTASSRDLRQVGAMSLREHSTLGDLASNLGANLFSASPPVGGDGFLATNSLVAFFVLVFRAYAIGRPELGKLPSTYRALTTKVRHQLRDVKQVVERQHVIVLYAPSLLAAALDLESKFHEAGLAAVQLADFRNFAHGRHNWIAKHRETTGVIALISPDNQAIAAATMKILQEQVPIAQIHCEGSNQLHSLAALRVVFEATAIAGQLRGIDPGRPGVPPFGRRIYNLRGFRSVSLTRKATLDLAAERKVGGAWSTFNQSQKSKWKVAARTYLKSLRAARFGSVVLDFDGTLCSKHDRFEPLSRGVAQELERLLRGGVTIGIATGRGKSARMQIRQSLGREWWDHLWIGYYNGADIGCLSDDTHPDVGGESQPILAAIAECLQRDGLIRTLATVERRPAQVTLEPTAAVGLEELYRHALALVRRHHGGVKVVMSSHSLDIVPALVSKTSVVRHVSSMSKNAPTLCIGDAGEYPGNDYELLAESYSLSCDQVSADPTSCWNFAPPAHRGVKATLFYLKHLAVAGHGAALRLPVDEKR